MFRFSRITYNVLGIFFIQFPYDSIFSWNHRENYAGDHLFILLSLQVYKTQNIIDNAFARISPVHIRLVKVLNIFWSLDGFFLNKFGVFYEKFWTFFLAVCEILRQIQHQLISIETKLHCKRKSKLSHEWISSYNLLVNILDPKMGDESLTLAHNLVAVLRNFRPLSDDSFVTLRQQLDRIGKSNKKNSWEKLNWPKMFLTRGGQKVHWLYWLFKLTQNFNPLL